MTLKRPSHLNVLVPRPATGENQKCLVGEGMDRHQVQGAEWTWGIRTFFPKSQVPPVLASGPRPQQWYRNGEGHCRFPNGMTRLRLAFQDGLCESSKGCQCWSGFCKARFCSTFELFFWAEFGTLSWILQDGAVGLSPCYTTFQRACSRKYFREVVYQWLAAGGSRHAQVQESF